MKALIVDDQEINRQVLISMLEDSFECLEASSGQEAIDIVDATDDLNIILMDVVMPGLDGLETTRIIKEKIPEDKHIPIIFVTGRDDKEALGDCFAAGGDDYIARPVDKTTLFSRVNAHKRIFDLADHLSQQNRELTYYRESTAREHAVIEHVFNNVIRPAMLDCESLSCYLSPAEMFNGDLYLASRNEDNGCTYEFLGDFTGHGLSAAIGCMPVSDVFYAMTRKGVNLEAIASEANRKLLQILPDNMFCCAVIMEFPERMDQVKIWSGGMHDVLVIDPEGKVISTLESQNMPLGILSAEEFDSSCQVFDLPKDSRLISFTDGIVEAANNEGELFGEDRLEQSLLGVKDDLIGAALSALESFQAEGEQKDDITLVQVTTNAVSQEAKTESDGGAPEEANLLAEIPRPAMDVQFAADPWRMRLVTDASGLRPDAIDGLIAANIVRASATPISMGKLSALWQCLSSKPAVNRREVEAAEDTASAGLDGAFVSPLLMDVFTIPLQDYADAVVINCQLQQVPRLALAIDLALANASDRRDDVSMNDHWHFAQTSELLQELEQRGFKPSLTFDNRVLSVSVALT